MSVILAQWWEYLLPEHTHLATTALYVQSVQDSGVQADYLAIAPGKQLVY